MNLTLKRINYGPKGVFSVIIDPSGCMRFMTGEHAYDGNLPKLPNGLYSCLRGTHQLDHGDPIEAFEILNVPGHTGILFHIGNFPQSDSAGCVLLGRGLTIDLQPMVSASSLAFNDFMQLQKDVDHFQLVVL